MQITRTKTITIIPLSEDYRLLPEYIPEKLLDMLYEVMQVANDAQLSAAMKIGPEVISKIRHRRLSITAAVIMRMSDASGLTIDNIRVLAGIPRPSFE
jgi:hypothetical protein